MTWTQKQVLLRAMTLAKVPFAQISEYYKQYMVGFKSNMLEKPPFKVITV